MSSPNPLPGETFEQITVAGDNITAALLVWRRFKAVLPGQVERLLTVNTGLAKLGPVIPIGTIVKVPIPAPRKPDDVTAVRLWS